MIIIKNNNELALMKTACRLSAEALLCVRDAIKPGATTYEIDKIAEKFIFSHGGECTFKNYNGFPGNICISINSEVIHGTASKKRVLHEGDIVSVDLGAKIGGFTGDNAFTFPVGKVSDKAAQLMKITRESLYKGICNARSGNRIGAISNAIQQHVESNGFFVVKKYVGHGVGKQLHEDPQIPNFGLEMSGQRLATGMTIAIEPMVNEKTSAVRKMQDGWTVVEAKNGLSAHFEHTVAITDNEPYIMTMSELWEL